MKQKYIWAASDLHRRTFHSERNIFIDYKKVEIYAFNRFDFVTKFLKNKSNFEDRSLILLHIIMHDLLKLEKKQTKKSQQKYA